MSGPGHGASAGTARIRLARSAAMESDPGPHPALRYASANGRQFFVMASGWPELAGGERLTGIYHAAGRCEKEQIKAMGRDLVVEQGFDVLKPAAMIFEHVPLGPLAQLAIALGCQGPFWSIEADELAGPTAVLQALEDLADGRCDQAIVAGYDFDPPAARAMLLVRDDAASATLSWQARFTYVPFGPGTADVPPPGDVVAVGEALGVPVAVLAGGTDHHGLALAGEAFERAANGEIVAVWRRAPDGRGLLLGVRVRPEGEC